MATLLHTSFAANVFSIREAELPAKTGNSITREAKLGSINFSNPAATADFVYGTGHMPGQAENPVADEECTDSSLSVQLFEDSDTLTFMPNMNACKAGKVFAGDTADGKQHVTLVSGPTSGTIAASVVDQDSGMIYTISSDANGEMMVVQRSNTDYGEELEPSDVGLEETPPPEGISPSPPLEPVTMDLQKEKPMKDKPPQSVKPFKLGKSLGIRGASFGDRHLQTGDTEIDVMVVWTAKAECKRANQPQDCTTNASTKSGMRGLIDLAIEETNVAYANSGISLRIRLVHAAILPDYVEPGFGDSLSQLRSQNDGQLDYVHTWREQYGADVVAMLIDDPQYCGLGYLGPRKDLMFSVTAWNCATGLYTFGHEIGHNFGCNHDKGTTDTCSNQSVYNYGYRDPQARFRSIMAYGCTTGQCDNNAGGYCTRVQIFSTPDIQYNGMPIGAADTDNARRINEKRVEVASYLPTRVGGPSATPTSQPTPCNGRSITVNIKTDNYPVETSWTIQEECGAGLIASGSGYSSNTDISESLCLPNSEYTFTITDSYGDGICCGYGQGSFSLVVDGSVAKSGGEFTTSDEYTFGSCSGESPVTPNPTSQPTKLPTKNPTSQPTNQPVTPAPSSKPTSLPTNFPTTFEPTYQPSLNPTESATSEPSSKPTPNPTEAVTPAPSSNPTSLPTNFPTQFEPTYQPSLNPTETVTSEPSPKPTSNPTEAVTSAPSPQPTKRPIGYANAVYDASLGAPRCSTLGDGCDSGSLLNKASCAEENGPNSIDSCSDGDSAIQSV